MTVAGAAGKDGFYRQLPLEFRSLLVTPGSLTGRRPGYTILRQFYSIRPAGKG